MIIQMADNHTDQHLDKVVEAVGQMGFQAHILRQSGNVRVGITGNLQPLDPALFLNLTGVASTKKTPQSFKLVSRAFQPEPSCFQLGQATLGAGHFAVIAGPCAVESEAQTLRIAHAVKQRGATMLRGGAYKPRSSPYSFHGLGVEGLKILAQARAETGLAVVTEALDQQSLDAVYQYADMIQIGARNMQNFSFLRQVGQLDKPVLLKRGMSATIEEWLLAAEYIAEEGNCRIVLAERGVRSFDPHTRNMLDLAAVPVLQELSHLPVLVDPSHGTGRRSKVAPMSRAAMAAGAQAIMVDVHDRPEEALCDGPQALSPDEFEALCQSLAALAPALGVKMSGASRLALS